jgi:hypothetical protein
MAAQRHAHTWAIGAGIILFYIRQPRYELEYHVASTFKGPLALLDPEAGGECAPLLRCASPVPTSAITISGRCASKFVFGADHTTHYIHPRLLPRKLSSSRTPRGVDSTCWLGTVVGSLEHGEAVGGDISPSGARG